MSPELAGMEMGIKAKMLAYLLGSVAVSLATLVASMASTSANADEPWEEKPLCVNLMKSIQKLPPNMLPSEIYKTVRFNGLSFPKWKPAGIDATLTALKLNWFVIDDPLDEKTPVDLGALWNSNEPLPPGYSQALEFIRKESGPPTRPDLQAAVKSGIIVGQEAKLNFGKDYGNVSLTMVRIPTFNKKIINGKVYYKTGIIWKFLLLNSIEKLPSYNEIPLIPYGIDDIITIYGRPYIVIPGGNIASMLITKQFIDANHNDVPFFTWVGECNYNFNYLGIGIKK